MNLVMRNLSLAWIGFLNVGCQTIELPHLDDHERCVVSVKYQVCRCHAYRVTPEKVGRVSESYNRPINYCNNLIGFKPTQWVNYVLWFEESFQAVEDANTQEIEKPEFETPQDIRNLIMR